MKRNSIFVLSFLTLSLFTGCTANNSSSLASTPASSEPTSEVTPEPVSLDTALASLKSDFIASLSVKNGRNYLNPWYTTNNGVKSLFVDQEFRSTDEGKNVHAGLTLSEQKGGIKVPLSTQKIIYEADTGLVSEEHLNHKNERIVRRMLDASSTNFIHVSDTDFYNHYQNLRAEDFLQDTEDASKFTYSGSLASDIAKDMFGFYGKVTSATFTLTDSKFTAFEFAYEDCEGTWVGTDFAGADFVESLAISGTFAYDNLTLTDLAPHSGSKVAAIDNVLAKYKDQSKFAVQPVNPELIEDGAGIQVIYDEDKIAIDFYDIFSMGELNTLSWLDGKFVEDAETGKYYINNLALNEETYEFFWQTSKETVEAADQTVSDGAVLFEKDAFKLDFANIDSSLFTLREGSEDTYDLNPAAAKYFGECIVPTITDYSATMMGTYMHLDVMTYTGSSWSVRILDDSSLFFEYHGSLDFNGSTTNNSWGFILTGAGTADASPFYVDTVPVLAF